MEGHNILDRLGRVSAPEDFERRVLTELSRRRKRRAHTLLVRRCAFAGGAAIFLATFVLLNVFVLKQPGGVSVAGKGAAPGSAENGVIQVMETLDYSTEVHNASYEPQTVYILEQVSEASPQEITY